MHKDSKCHAVLFPGCAIISTPDPETMSGENISPRRTRSGLVICTSTTRSTSEEGVGRTTGSPEIGLGSRLVVPRLSLLGRGHGTGGTEQRGVEVVGRPAPHQRVGASEEEEEPEVIDLSDDEISQQQDGAPGNAQPASPIGAAYMEMQNNSRAEANFPETSQTRALVNTTIDLTMSPISSATGPFPQTSSLPTSSTVPPSSPSLPSIQCPVCMESINSIRMKGKITVRTTAQYLYPDPRLSPPVHCVWTYLLLSLPP